MRLCVVKPTRFSRLAEHARHLGAVAPLARLGSKELHAQRRHVLMDDVGVARCYLCFERVLLLYSYQVNHVSGTWYMTPDTYTAAVLVQFKVSIEPPQHRPSARAASARAALSTSSERRDPTQMPSVLGESRESCRLNKTQAHSNKPQLYIPGIGV